MTDDEARMKKEIRNPNNEASLLNTKSVGMSYSFVIRASGFVILG